jgi:hypothetical protein
MGINASKMIIKSQVPDPQPIKVDGAPSLRINTGNMIIKNKIEEAKPVESKVYQSKKKEIFLSKRNRTGIFNLEKPSSYMIDMLATQE